MAHHHRIALFLKLAAVCLVVALAAGCGGEDVGRRVEWETVKKGHLGFAFKTTDEPEFKVFRTKKAWEKFWNTAAERNPVSEHQVPGIVKGRPFVDPDTWSDQLSPIAYLQDFRSTDMIVGAFFTENMGTDAAITEVRRYSDRVVVKVERKVHRLDEVGFVSPYHIIKLKKVYVPIKFELIDEKPPIDSP